MYCVFTVIADSCAYLAVRCATAVVAVAVAAAAAASAVHVSV
jgi:hypothetical protein